MRDRSFLSDFFMILFFAMAGAIGGLSLSLFRSRSLVSGAGSDTEALMRSGDLTSAALADIFLSGTLSLILLIVGFVVTMVLLAIGLLKHFRDYEKKIRGILPIVLGAVIGLVLISTSLLFASSFERASQTMEGAGIGEAAIIGALFWPRIFYGICCGAVIGWSMGALRSEGLVRKILLLIPALILAVVAIFIPISVKPPVVTLPSNIPELASGDEGYERMIWVIGDADKAYPIKVDIGLFVSHQDSSSTLSLRKGNVMKAQKVATALPLLHPRSAAAERLIVAGYMSELDVGQATKQLIENFHKRGHPLDAMLATSLLARMSPSETAIKLLKKLANTDEFSVGTKANKELCPLVRVSGQKKIATQLSCTGKVTKSKTGKVTFSIAFKGRPLRHAPFGLIKEKAGVKAAWLKNDIVNVSALKIAIGGKTDREGDAEIDSILPGTYLLAVAPRRHSKNNDPLELNKAFPIVIPQKGGTIELGSIEAGGELRKRRSHRKRRIDFDDYPAELRKQLEGQGMPDILAEGLPDIPEENIEEDQDHQEEEIETQDQDQGDQQERQARRLPRSAQRLIDKVRSVGPNRVIVEEGFGDLLLNASRSAFGPNATVVPHLSKAGRPIGLEVRGIRPNGVAHVLGFEEGDIVQSVNGHKTRQPDDLVDLVDELQGADRIRVKVKRGRRIRILNIEVGP